ncbi:MAG: GNAT family N-acetyltransferase [Oscillospiraceae bacterium]|nr:GNAT family N-acetyltransferase [Oscillospiraceae bacterium]
MFFDTNDLLTEEIFLKLTRTSPADPEKNWVPAYHFNICRASDGCEVGKCDLRIGYNRNTYFGGNIGYAVHENFRGNHYAGKACLLLFRLARKHEMPYIYITCAPDNFASRKTCEYAGGVLESIADLPEDSDIYILEGRAKECIYRFNLQSVF